jgi:hypothetical protein
MTRIVERCRSEIAAKQQFMACGCLEALSPVIPVNQMQSLIVSWRCKRFVNYLCGSISPRLRRIDRSRPTRSWPDLTGYRNWRSIPRGRPLSPDASRFSVEGALRIEAL